MINYIVQSHLDGQFVLGEFKYYNIRYSVTLHRTHMLIPLSGNCN